MAAWGLRARKVAAELIGGARTQRNYYKVNNFPVTLTRDWSRRDYAFWDRARRCQAAGLELAGLFIKPLGSKTAAWTMGDVPEWSVENDAADDALNNWWKENHAKILRAVEEATDLGDAFLVVNADMSLTLLPPNVVTPVVSEEDYSTILGWKVTEVHAHPAKVGERMVIEDTYTLGHRTRKTIKNGATIKTEEFSIPIPFNPVINIANNPGADEVFGSPEGSALVSALHRYGELFDAAITGNVHQGRPTPVALFETKAEADAFFERYGRRETRTLEDGTTETFYTIDFSSDNFLAISAKDFKYAQPGSFVSDTEKLLGLIFYLVLQHTEIPEFVWGNAIASSKASADAQMPAFIRWIEKKRGDARSWMLQLARVVLSYLAARGEAPFSEAYQFDIHWEPLGQIDGALTLETIKWAFLEGLITEQTALMLLPVEIEDPASELEQARQEREEREAKRLETQDAEAQINSKYLNDEAKAQQNAQGED